MSSLPSHYSHVFSTEAPSLIKQAAKLLGVEEKRGSENNPAIIQWAHEVEGALNKSLGYNADSIPWCGLFAAVVAVRADWVGQIPREPLWARAWLEFGQDAPIPAFGDVLVFGRDGGGHVGFYVGEGTGVFHVLGGNQGDRVSIVRIAKRRFLGARRPRWRISQPSSVKPIHLDASNASGPVSRNEA